jgi:hypothetical protein
MASAANTTRVTIESRVSALWVTATAAARTTVAWEDWPFDPPEIDASEPYWINIKVVFGQGELITKNGRNTLAGFVQVSVFGPADQGLGGVYGLADKVRDMFNRVTVSGVRFLVPGVPRMVPRIQAMRFMSSPDIPWVQAIVACPFTFDEEVT